VRAPFPAAEPSELRARAAGPWPRVYELAPGPDICWAETPRPHTNPRSPARERTRRLRGRVSVARSGRRSARLPAEFPSLHRSGRAPTWSS